MKTKGGEMIDLRKLHAGRILMNNAFEPVRFRFSGRVIGIGLQKQFDVVKYYHYSTGQQTNSMLLIEPIDRRSGTEYFITFSGSEVLHQKHVSGRYIVPVVNEILRHERLEELKW